MLVKQPRSPMMTNGLHRKTSRLRGGGHRGEHHDGHQRARLSPPAYNELCSSYHAIDDFRTKLLGFLPLVTGGGLILLSGRAEDVRKEFFGPVGRFGILVTLGLLAYELFGIKKCHALIQAGQTLEREMDRLVGDKPDKPAGQFIRRPNNLLWVVNEPFAAALIHPAVLAAWSYLAVLYDNPSHTADPSRAQQLSLYVFVGGFALVLLYDGFLRNRDKLRDWWKRGRSPGPGHERANDQPSQAVSEVRRRIQSGPPPAG